MLVPGVSFNLVDGFAQPALKNIRAIAAVVTYGRPRYMAWWVGDPPRRIVTRYLHWLTGKQGRPKYFAHYHMNKATPESCARFIARVDAGMRGLA